MFVSERINVNYLSQDTPLHSFFILQDSQSLQNFVDQFSRDEATQFQAYESTETAFGNVYDTLQILQHVVMAFQGV